MKPLSKRVYFVFPIPKDRRIKGFNKNAKSFSITIARGRIDYLIFILIHGHILPVLPAELT